MGPSSNPQLSEQNLESNPDQVIHTLLEAFAGSTGRTLPKTNLVIAHRWRYARGTATDRQRCFLHHPETRLTVIGDWLFDGRIEEAFLSGWEAVDQLCN